jgi:hypothetical protein
MKVKIILLDSYLETIKKSIGAELFQTLWAEVNGRKRDILQKGEKSCAVFVSGILLWFGLISSRHATVKGTVADMKQAGWKKIAKPKIGSVLHWEAEESNGSVNEHLGFYVGHKQAISTSRTRRVPVLHHWTYGQIKGKPKRKIIAIYWHPKLNRQSPTTR